MDHPPLDVNWFHPRKLKQLQEAIRDDPNLSAKEAWEIDYKIDILRSRFKGIDDILGPLLEAYHKDRKRLDPKYNPSRDAGLENTYKVGIGEMNRLNNEIENLHSVRKRMWAAREARSTLAELKQQLDNL